MILFHGLLLHAWTRQQMVNWCFGGPVVWIPGISLWKGLLLRGIPRIPKPLLRPWWNLLVEPVDGSESNSPETFTMAEDPKPIAVRKNRAINWVQQIELGQSPPPKKREKQQTNDELQENFMLDRKKWSTHPGSQVNHEKTKVPWNGWLETLTKNHAVFYGSKNKPSRN